MTNISAQKLQIPLIAEPLSFDIQGIRSEIELRGVKVSINKVNWSAYPYQPLVDLYAGYSKSHLWLLYEVKRDFFRAKAMIDQGTVWEDSCVEFFISTAVVNESSPMLSTNSFYRNFEFNVLGTCLSAYGNKFDRQRLSADEMKQILRFPCINKLNLPVEGAEFDWQLGVAIPLTVLGLRPGNSFYGNFYKCGNLTLKPHFLSWSEIESEAPDFHLPPYFGELELVI